MARLPQPGSDDGKWGAILNDFLSQAHTSEGALKPDIVTKDVLAPHAVDATALGPTSGTDGQVLTRDSSKVTGIDWQTPSGGGSVTSVAGKTGVVTLVKGDVGLGSVDNTSDAGKPVSSATQTALDAKVSTNLGGQETVSVNNAATGSVALNLANGNIFSLRLTGNVTSLSISGAVNNRGCSCTLYLTQDATGGRTMTWPASFKWSGGVPTLSTAANAVDIVVCESIDGGTTWFASLVGKAFN